MKTYTRKIGDGWRELNDIREISITFDNGSQIDLHPTPAGTTPMKENGLSMMVLRQPANLDLRAAYGGQGSTFTIKTEGK